MFRRLTVAVLLIATVATLAWRWEGFISLIQGVILAAAVLIPALVINALVSFKYRHLRADLIDSSDTLSSDTAHDNAATQDRKLPASDHRESNIGLAIDKTTINADARNTDNSSNIAKPEKIQQAIVSDASTDAVRPDVIAKPAPAPAMQQRLKRRRASSTTQTTSLHESTSLHPDFDNVEITLFTDEEDSPAEVQEQLHKLSDAVQSHDLSDSKESLSMDNGNWKKIRESHDRQTALSTDLITSVSSITDVSKLGSQEINQLVSTLTKDKLRLQKLVIAQQAAIESERQSHDKSRTVARDAIKIMRDARDAQKMAEKLARRERTERKRIEQQYKSVASALDNALSIIETRKKQAQSGSA